MRPQYLRRAVAGLAAAGLLAAPAHPATVTLNGTIANSCSLSVGSDGRLVLSTSGTEFGSESGAGGSAASLSVLAAGAAPTLTFSAPASSLSGATAEIRYTHSGTAQSYTSGSTTSSAALIDTYTINGRLTRSSGFPDGTHSVTTTVTCQQGTP